MKQVKTKSGFEIEVDEKSLDDMELLDMIAELTDGNGLRLPKIISKVCGDEGKKRLYEHCRNEAGRVPTETISTEITEIFEALNAKKS